MYVEERGLGDQTGMDEGVDGISVCDGVFILSPGDEAWGKEEACCCRKGPQRSQEADVGVHAVAAGQPLRNPEEQPRTVDDRDREEGRGAVERAGGGGEGGEPQREQLLSTSR